MFFLIIFLLCVLSLPLIFYAFAFFFISSSLSNPGPSLSLDFLSSKKHSMFLSDTLRGSASDILLFIYDSRRKLLCTSILENFRTTTKSSFKLHYMNKKTEYRMSQEDSHNHSTSMDCLISDKPCHSKQL